MKILTIESLQALIKQHGFDNVLCDRMRRLWLIYELAEKYDIGEQLSLIPENNDPKNLIAFLKNINSVKERAILPMTL